MLEAYIVEPLFKWSCEILPNPIQGGFSQYVGGEEGAPPVSEFPGVL